MKNSILIIKSHLKTPHFILKNILWRFGRTISKVKVVFVIGTPRSGTTLLQTILASHSKLYSIQSETAIFSFQNFWSPTRNLFDFDKLTKQQILDDSNDNVDFFSKSVEHLNKSNPGKIFVEKTPQHILRLSFLIKHFPDAKFIHIVRDGRDCYCSAKKHPFFPQSKSLKAFSKYYNKCVSNGIKFKNSKKLYNLRYEDLTENPKQMLLELMSFLNLDFEESQMDSSIRGKDKRTKYKHHNKLGDPINNSSVGKWQIELSKKENEKFIKYAGFSLRHFGYI